MDLALTIYNSVLKAKGKLGTLIESAILKTDSAQVYDANVGKKITTYIDKSIQVVIDKFKFNEIDNVLIKSTDIKLIMFSDNLVIPKLNHSLNYRNIIYSIINIQPVNAGNKTVIYILQLRN